VWDWIGDLISPSTGTGAKWELHALLAIVIAILFGVVAAKIGHDNLPPYAAIAGFALYAGIAISRALRRQRRGGSRRFR